MTVIEKIQKLSDKRNGVGIPMTTISKYCHCHPNAITYYYPNDTKPKPETVKFLEKGLQDLLKEIKEIIEG